MSDAALGRSPRPGRLLQPPRDDADRSQQLGMRLFLASLTMLFGATVVAYLVVRSSATTWPPADAPQLPRILWLSTALVAGCSVGIQFALNAVRAGNSRGLLRGLNATALCAVAFCASQVWAGWRFFHASTFGEHLYGFTFYMLTGVHVLHVVGGMVALLVLLRRARAGAYDWSVHAPVRNGATYWHYLAAVWAILFAILHT